MGTLRIPDVVPSPTEDCESLMKAFKVVRFCVGLGTNEKSVISVLGHRNASQRKKIRETYQQLYNKSLVDDLNAELSGDFRKAVVLWTYEPSERDARLANEALKSKKKTITQLQVIVEIACASSPDHLVAVRQAYCSLFNCSLEEDITAYVPMPVWKILIGLVRSYRYDKAVVRTSIANKEAAILREAIRTKQLDSDNFLMILSTRNVHQLRATFECYKQNYGFSIDQDIKSCGKGLLESLLKVAIWCIDSPEKHFAEVIKASVVGIGTDEDSLTRAIVTRAEVDMMKVRGEYFIANKTSLDNAVIDDTSGVRRRGRPKKIIEGSTGKQLKDITKEIEKFIKEIENLENLGKTSNEKGKSSARKGKDSGKDGESAGTITHTDEIRSVSFMNMINDEEKQFSPANPTEEEKVTVKPWRSLFTGNRLAENGMNLAYIPPEIVEAKKNVKLDKIAVEKEEEKWKCALIMYTLGNLPGYNVMTGSLKKIGII